MSENIPVYIVENKCIRYLQQSATIAANNTNVFIPAAFAEFRVLLFQFPDYTCTKEY